MPVMAKVNKHNKLKRFIFSILWIFCFISHLACLFSQPSQITRIIMW